MRQITKDIQISIDGSQKGFRLTKPDAFSGVEILRLLLRLQDQWGAEQRGEAGQRGRFCGPAFAGQDNVSPPSSCRGCRPFSTENEHTGSFSGRFEPTGGGVRNAPCPAEQ